MVKITSDDLSNMKDDKVDSGCFGTVYRKDDKVYKVYKPIVKNYFKEPIDNPLLEFPHLTMLKLKRIIAKRKSIEHTDLIEDILFVDNHFAGCVMPYYEGDLFLNLIDLPLEKRIGYSRELVRNTKELTDHYIYLLDQRIKNVMLVNGETKIIDADDLFAKAPIVYNPYYHLRSIRSLSRTIYSFLHEDFRSTHNEDILKVVSRQYSKLKNTYKGIEEYLDIKSENIQILFIDSEFNLSDSNLIDGRVVVLVYDKFNPESIVETINYFKSRGIIVYDVVSKGDIDFFLNNHMHDECLSVEHNQVLTLKQKQ